MAKKRMITQTINIDEDFNSLSDQAQLLFLKFISITDDCGVIPGNPFTLKSLISLSPKMNEKFSGYLQEITVNKLLFPIIHNDKYFFCFKKESFEENQKYLIKNRTKSEYMKISIEQFDNIYSNLQEFTVIYKDSVSYHIERIKIKNKDRDKEAEIPKNNLELVSTLHTSIIKSFTDHYFKTKNIEYVFNGGKDGTATKQIITKLKKICAEDKQTDEDILKAFVFMLNNISDNWILDNLELSIINSKFNQIISQIKNGKSTNNNGQSNKGFDIRKNTWIAEALNG